MKNTTTLQPPNGVLRKQPNKETDISDRLLWEFSKQELPKVRELIDLKLDLESLNYKRFSRAYRRIEELLTPYEQYLKNPSPETYRAFLKQEGLLASFLAPFPPDSPAAEPLMAQVLNGTSLIDSVREIAMDRVERAYADLYRTAREIIVEAVGTENFSATYATGLALFGPRAMAENPLSTDPLLMEVELLWLANSARIPRDQRQEANRQLVEIAKAMTHMGGGRPPLGKNEAPLSKRKAVARSKAVPHLWRKYTAYLKEGTAKQARHRVEEELKENKRISPDRKPSILLVFRIKVKAWEATLSAARSK